MASRERARIVLVAVVVLTFVVCGAARRRLAGVAGDPARGVPATVVSLAPSLTETVFALGAGERVVGVTRYCRYPPEAMLRPKVGGYFDPNYEAILRLRPDLVLTLEEHGEVRERLAKAGIRGLAVDHTTIEGILTSITEVGERLGLSAQSLRIAADLRGRVDAVQRAAAGKDRPRVLIVVDRTVGAGVPGRLFVCGRDRHFDPMIRWAGGENAYQGPDVAYPLVTPEGLLRMDPDVIIDLIPSTSGKETLAAAQADWEGLPALRALRAGRIHVWSEDYTMIPGPRFILALERMLEVFHPESGPPRQTEAGLSSCHDLRRTAGSRGAGLSFGFRRRTAGSSERGSCERVRRGAAGSSEPGAGRPRPDDRRSLRVPGPPGRGPLTTMSYSGVPNRMIQLVPGSRAS